MKKIISASLLILLLIGAFGFVPLGQSVRAQQTGAFSSPPGFPGSSALNSTGYAFADLVVQSAQYKSLAHGIPFHVEPYSSFGYTWGAGIQPTERVVLFSPDEHSYIVAEVGVTTSHIDNIYLANDTQVGDIYQNGLATPNGGGYYSQFCTGSWPGWCYADGYVSEAYGNVRIPSTISAPTTNETSACCQLAEWTGVTSGIENQLTQGGAAWSGFNQPKLPGSNAKGFILFVEYVPSPTDHGSGPVYISPPSWMNGVQGQLIKMTTTPDANCEGGGDLWFQYWQVGSSFTSQSIQCVSSGSENYAWYIYETPGNNSSCVSGGYNGICQTPKFSAMGFTGNICESSNCRNINSNGDQIQAVYIQHSAIDTATSVIPADGNSWQETYLSSS